MRTALCLSLVIAAGCSSAPNPCTTANCTALVACRLELRADGAEACSRKGLHPPLALDVSGCLQACEGTGEGTLVSCISTFGAACVADAHDGGMEAQIACDPSKPAHQQACLDGCAAARTTCEDKCSGASWAGCLPCATGCGIQEHSCFAACPRVM